MDFSPDGRRLAIGEWKSTVVVELAGLVPAAE
jgi:hypothetical protein